MLKKIIVIMLLVAGAEASAEVNMDGCRQTKNKGYQCKAQTQATYDRKDAQYRKRQKKHGNQARLNVPRKTKS